uniref:DNA translocase FtsK n=1 Tax=Amycolatopsis sp. CA-151526 TaxID=3239921 RepID=UPI003F498B97
MMAENAEAERHVSQAMLAAMSVALGVAVQLQQHRVARARAALAESEERQREIAAQLAAERETAAVLWRRLDDREWIKSRPDEVAQAWASARAWEQLDPRAAEARARLESVLGVLYDQDNPIARMAMETQNYDVLAVLLQRAVEYEPDNPPAVTFYEEVPAAERAAWLEREVWGPDSQHDPQRRIARSAELADLNAGLPIAVLREMPEDRRAAWVELEAMDPQERHAWRRQWLERQVWGRPDLSHAEREQRARQLEELLDTRVDTPVEFTPEEWTTFAAEFQDRMGRSNGPAEPDLAESAPGSDAPAERAPDGTARSTTAGGGETSTAVPRESDHERLERTRAAVRASWPPEVAEAVTGKEAFGAFAHRLHQLEERGYSMEDILGRIRPEGLIGLDRYGQPVRDSAAFAEYHVKQLAKSLPPRAEAEAGIERLEKYVAEQNRTGAASPGDEQHETAVRAIRSVWSHDAEWIVGSQSRSVDRLAEALAEARQRGLDPIEFMREAVRASGMKQLTSPNRAVGEADPTPATTYEAGITHPGVLGTDPAKFAERQVRKRLAELEQPAPETPAAGAAVPAQREVDPAQVREAARLVTESRFGASSMLQRKMRLSYQEADRLLDALHEKGIVGAADGGKPRQVLAGPDEIDAKLSMRSGLGQVPGDEPAQRQSGPASPWSRAGAQDRGLGGEDASVEEIRAAEDHDRARQLDEVQGEVQQQGDGSSVERQVTELDAASDRLDNAACEHETTAEQLRAGAYEQGSDAAQLAGKSNPRDITSSLARHSGKKGAMPKARRIQPGQQIERGR